MMRKVFAKAHAPLPYGVCALTADTVVASRAPNAMINAATTVVTVANHQFSVGFSAWSMTRISTGALVASSLRPSCS